jgi:DNA-binding transcriptional MerR regulator
MSYRGPQVCSIVGITYRQLDHWTRTDLISASVADAAGSGTQRLYSYNDLLELKVIKSMIDSGLDLRKVRKVIGYVREKLGDDVATANLVITADSVLARTDGELIDLLRNGQGVLNIVPVAGMRNELDAQVSELHPSEPAASDAAGAPPRRAEAR